MKAIILAAGVSRRLYPMTFDTPKSLLKLDGKPIIDYQLDALRSVGIDEIVIVLGYYSEMFVDHLKKLHPQIKVTVVNNHHFFETNTAYSVWLCREQVGHDDVMLMNADVLYPVELIKRLHSSEYENVMAVDVKPCGDEEVKVIEGENKRIVAIGKKLIEENSLGEFIGVAKFSYEFMKHFFKSLDDLISAGGKSDYFEAAIDPILSKQYIFYEDITDLPCKEIDFLEDFNEAKELVKSHHYNG